MTREYVRTHVGVMYDTDYMVLSPIAKGAWHTLNMLQGQQTEERFKDRAHIAALLLREGFGPDAVAELEANRWIIDSPDSPSVELKGFHRWQARKRNQYMKDYRAARNSNEHARTESSPVPYRPVPEGVQGGPAVEPDPTVTSMEALGRVVRRATGKGQ